MGSSGMVLKGRYAKKFPLWSRCAFLPSRLMIDGFSIWLMKSAFSWLFVMTILTFRGCVKLERSSHHTGI